MGLTPRPCSFKRMQDRAWRFRCVVILSSREGMLCTEEYHGKGSQISAVFPCFSHLKIVLSCFPTWKEERLWQVAPFLFLSILLILPQVYHYTHDPYTCVTPTTSLYSRLLILFSTSGFLCTLLWPDLDCILMSHFKSLPVLCCTWFVSKPRDLIHLGAN